MFPCVTTAPIVSKEVWVECGPGVFREKGGVPDRGVLFNTGLRQNRVFVRPFVLSTGHRRDLFRHSVPPGVRFVETLRAVNETACLVSGDRSRT